MVELATDCAVECDTEGSVLVFVAVVLSVCTPVEEETRSLEVDMDEYPPLMDDELSGSWDEAKEVVPMVLVPGGGYDVSLRLPIVDDDASSLEAVVAEVESSLVHVELPEIADDDSDRVGCGVLVLGGGYVSLDVSDTDEGDSLIDMLTEEETSLAEIELSGKSLDSESVTCEVVEPSDE